MKRLLSFALVLGLIGQPLYADLFVVGQATSGTVIGGAVSGGTSTRVLFVDGSGNLAGDADLTFSTDTLTATKTVVTGLAVFGSAADAISAISFNETASQITWEGAAADAAEHRLAATVNAGFDTLTTIPATGASQTVMVLENAQTITGLKTFSQINFTGPFGPVLTNDTSLIIGTAASSAGGFVTSTAVTPDAGLIMTGTVSRSVSMVEYADLAYDFNNCSAGTSAATDPLFCIHSHNQATNQWIDFSHNGTNGVINVGLGALVLPAHSGSSGTAPAVSACGSSPTTVTGNDSYGRLTTGSGGTLQSCTLTFAVAYAVAPSCICNDETAIVLLRATATTTTLVCDSAVAGTMESAVINYICHGL